MIVKVYLQESQHVYRGEFASTPACFTCTHAHTKYTRTPQHTTHAHTQPCFYSGGAVDIGGYYEPDPVKTEKAMRPSATFNSIIDG